MWRPDGGVGGEEGWRNRRWSVNYELLTKAGVITRFTCVVERDSSGVITQKWNSELWRGNRDIIHRRGSRAVVKA